ncbi:hypothetical protein F7734_23260 [Scytonema sp. UIC 10036]|uniref:hypothetical protein n=1 Tax=Scytonema sp. UIC 10036 TaxID=2304196 RepID=UPI0012DAEBE0|nr:hypothetical protein [Scytonema sp. UIC 10036]MUG95120.1 hypothetical protein [Scytonema sp. UIC 10036]
MTDNFDESNSESSQAIEDLLKRASSHLTANQRCQRIRKMTPVWAWLYITQGMERYQVLGDNWHEVTEPEILELTSKCQFTELDDMSENSNAKAGLWFDIGLNGWWGSEIKACKFGNTETDGILFFFAKRCQD